VRATQGPLGRGRPLALRQSMQLRLLGILQDLHLHLRASLRAAVDVLVRSWQVGVQRIRYNGSRPDELT